MVPVMKFSIFQVLDIVSDQTPVALGRNMIALIAFSKTAILNREKDAVLWFLKRREGLQLGNFSIGLQYAKTWDKCVIKQCRLMVQSRWILNQTLKMVNLMFLQATFAMNK